jgi:DNA-binding HxlR family transcriptional regulator
MIIGSGNGTRSGAQTLVLLSMPLNSAILRALADGPGRQTELRAATGAPAQTTLRAQLKKLVDVGAVEKHRRNRFPGIIECDLTPIGRDLLPVIAALETWLSAAPQGPLELGGSVAKAAVKALAEGWTSTMIRAIAAGPVSLTELDCVIGPLSYPSLERRLSALRLAGMVEPSPNGRRGTPYVATRWLREALGPLAAAVRWERRHAPRSAPAIGPLDIEAAFLLAAPMLRPAPAAAGSCRLAVELNGGARRRIAGALIEVEHGAVVSCSTNLDGPFDAWAIGSPGAWLDAVLDGNPQSLEMGGDCALAHSLVESFAVSGLYRSHTRP